MDPDADLGGQKHPDPEHCQKHRKKFWNLIGLLRHVQASVCNSLIAKMLDMGILKR
jgi:hypothetical protein